MVDEDVGVLIENLVGLGDLGIVENVVVFSPQCYAPVVTTLHRSFMYDSRAEFVLLSAELFLCRVEDRLAVLDLTVVNSLEAVEVEHQYGGEGLHMELLEGQGHGVTLVAVPCILLVKLLGLGKQLQAIMESGLPRGTFIFLGVADLKGSAQVDFEANL